MDASHPPFAKMHLFDVLDQGTLEDRHFTPATGGGPLAADCFALAAIISGLDRLSEVATMERVEMRCDISPG